MSVAHSDKLGRALVSSGDLERLTFIMLLSPNPHRNRTTKRLRGQGVQKKRLLHAR